jgi:PKD domain-containing protein
MVGRLPPRVRHALLAVIVALVAVSFLTTIPGASASSPSYVITGVVQQPNNALVPSGVTVQLTSGATHAIFTTVTGSSGQFTFNAANTRGALAPGWWGLDVPAQGGVVSKGCPVLSINNKCAALPASSAPQYFYANASTLTSSYSHAIANVTIVGYTTLLNATVTYQGSNVSGATVQVISPHYPGLILSGNQTNSFGITTFPAPAGSWILYTNFSATQFNYTALTIPSSGVDRVSVAFKPDYVTGTISSSTGGLVSAGYNQTLIDTTSGAYQFSAYSQYNPVGYSYTVGAYPAGFSGSGTETFELILAPIGYAPAFVPLSFPADAGTSHNVAVKPIAPPAVYNTTLNYTSGTNGSAFGHLNVSTVILLHNYSVFPDLSNASVGQLWGQLALDFAHSLTLTNATFAANILPWVKAQGPFFPVVQDHGLIDGSNFTQLGNYTTQTPNPAVTGGYAASYTLTSTQGLSMSYHQAFNVTTPLPKGGTGNNYTISFSYRHPTNGQSINYTIILPKGYVLKAGTAPPPKSLLLPGGPSKTWTKFYLVSQPSANANDTANFTLVKYGNVTARVNVSAASFTFSTKNVLSDARNNYTVVVGAGEKLTFSAANSTYPAGTNGSAFAWTFGDSTNTTTNQPTTTHYYNSTGKYVGSLLVTSSGGLSSSVGFTVYVGSLPPTVNIQGNWTSAENKSVSGAQYILINWSTSLQFNLTGSVSTLYAGGPNGVISDAVWNLTSHNFSKLLANYSAGAGANTSTPVSYSFQGAGSYLTAGLVNGNSVTPFLGWQYNLTLTLWDGQGHSAKKTLVILVRDTQKPIAVVRAYNSAGALLPSSGIVEGPSGTAYVRLSGKNSSEPHNGSIVTYAWKVNNSADTSFHITNSSVSWSMYFAPQNKPYRVNLTVTDIAGYNASTVYLLTVAFNTTTRPILTITNLTEATGLTAMTAGTSYTWWVNITNTGGKLSTAANVELALSLTGQTATHPGGNTAGTPNSVTFYNVTKGVVSTTPYTGAISLAYNQTVRASVSFNPSQTGSKFLWANASCSNCYTFVDSVTHVPVTVSQNQTQLYLEYAAIGGGALAVIIALVALFRRRNRAATAPAKAGGGRLERGPSSSKDEDEDEET